MYKVKQIMTVPSDVTLADLNDPDKNIQPDIMLVPVTNYKTASNARYYPVIGEINNEPSMTIPNQAMTVRELMIRFASGLPLKGQKVPIYEGDEEIPDIDKMELIEREEYYLELKKQREEVEERVKQRRIKAKEMKLEQIVQDRIAKKQKEEEDKVLEEFRKKRDAHPPVQ